MASARCSAMRPLPIGQMPAIARNSVDLPDPDGPVISTDSLVDTDPADSEPGHGTPDEHLQGQ